MEKSFGRGIPTKNETHTLVRPLDVRTLNEIELHTISKRCRFGSLQPGMQYIRYIIVAL